MSLRNNLTKVVFAAGFFSIWVLSSAYAQNWVRVVSNPGGDPSYVDIDVDSILKGADGLAYYDAQDDMGVSGSAIDCQARIFYVVGGLPDWKSHPYSIKPGSNPAKEADFVCSRVS
jgi:hypothetical protein